VRDTADKKPFATGVTDESLVWSTNRARMARALRAADQKRLATAAMAKMKS
jgi:hypothetical protein